MPPESMLPRRRLATGKWRPIAVRQVELSRGMRDLEGLGSYRTARVLLRYRGKPVAYRTMRVTDGRIPAAELWIAAGTTGSKTLRREALSDLLGAGERRAAPSLPSASIVVCTRNRPEDLERCLQSAMPLLGPAVEMLVVDNCR